ncbi:uncharacterized protein IL334_004442 [Kwoniella shivajii]|uniref:Uncharacterized protein n=1 Tax=Kwoniella shivajii TaxID=564305 RepID=A0ABZ1D0Q7_9TREE|nr:hypothetical protein IL334_004442 [Kwoniella shivajii]
MSFTPFRVPLVRPRSLLPSSLSSSLPRNQIASRSIHSSIPRPSNSTTKATSHPTQPHLQHANQHPHPAPSQKSGKKASPHMVWYREIVPAMIPIFLISTTLFLSLSLVRTHLSHSKSLAESDLRIEELETQLSQLRLEQKRQLVREKRERERILPLVVERVLQRVGVVGGDEDEEEKLQVEVKEVPRLL